MAGRSHALFRHHSDGARPLGQNTTRFSATRAHGREYHTHLPGRGLYSAAGATSANPNSRLRQTKEAQQSVIISLALKTATRPELHWKLESTPIPCIHLCDTHLGKKHVNTIHSSLVAGAVPVSSEAILPERSEKQYNQDRHLYHAVY